MNIKHKYCMISNYCIIKNATLIIEVIINSLQNLSGLLVHSDILLVQSPPVSDYLSTNMKNYILLL